jgi:hypothetical protein
MEKRSIEIEATGCHDCNLVGEDQIFCGYKGLYIAENIRNKNFHPDCPMTKKEK